MFLQSRIFSPQNAIDALSLNRLMPVCAAGRELFQAPMRAKEILKLSDCRAGSASYLGSGQVNRNGCNLAEVTFPKAHEPRLAKRQPIRFARGATSNTYRDHCMGDLGMDIEQ